MNNHIYYFYILLFLLIILSIGIDIFLVKGELSVKKSLQQLLLWVSFSGLFFATLLVFKNTDIALKYISGYVIEMSLSIDNVFVFILIFQQYKIKNSDSRKLLLLGILLAIVLRILFITIGIQLIDRFAWILFLFGPILIYTGVKIMTEKTETEKEIKDNAFMLWIQKTFRFSKEDPRGKYIIQINQKHYFTTLSLVVILLGMTDFVFALDSIPTIISLVKTDKINPFTSDEILVIYASNIFAILGLRALFVILKNMASQFYYLQKAIGVVLLFIGLKMLLEFLHIHIGIGLYLFIILIILSIGILLSKIIPKKNNGNFKIN